MTLLLEIPKEFEEHFNMDRFKDSLERIRIDIKFELEDEMKPNYMMLSGNYEMELLDMLRKAFNSAKVVQPLESLIDTKEKQ